MKLQSLLLVLPLTLSSPVVEERNNWAPSSILNDTYPQISFGQSRENINLYAKQSIQSLILAVNHTNGQFLDGIPNPVGRFFFWQSNNGWTGVSQYDLQQDTEHFFIYACEAYGHPIFLKRAVDIWNVSFSSVAS